MTGFQGFNAGSPGKPGFQPGTAGRTAPTPARTPGLLAQRAQQTRDPAIAAHEHLATLQARHVAGAGLTDERLVDAYDAVYGGGRTGSSGYQFTRRRDAHRAGLRAAAQATLEHSALHDPRTVQINNLLSDDLLVKVYAATKHDPNSLDRFRTEHLVRLRSVAQVALQAASAMTGQAAAAT